MRSAIVHDWFQGFHGAERTVAAMLDVFERDPDVFTFVAARELLPDRLARAIAGESRVAGLPGIRQRGHDPGRWRWLLPYMPRYFERLDLSDYEVVISSSHACAVGVRPPAAALHLCYCYTPMRYVWMPDAERGRASGVKGIALDLAARAPPRLGPPCRPAAGRLPGHLLHGRRPHPALLRPRGSGGRHRPSPPVTSLATVSATRTTFCGSTASCPTSDRSRWPPRSASSPTCD